MIIDTLKKARRLISRPDRWTTGHLAVTKTGQPTSVHSPTAHRFCALGALLKVARDAGEIPTALRLLQPLMKGAINLAVYNNTHSHEEVLILFDETIRRLEK